MGQRALEDRYGPSFRDARRHGRLFAAVLVGHHGYTQGTVSGGAFALTLVGFVLLTTGGWLGGAVVFVHGMRVLNLVSERFGHAAAPMPKEPEVARTD